MQRLIVAQIKQAAGQSSNDQYSGLVDYDHAPWVDWGPYLWTNGERPRQSDGLKWCNGQNDVNCGLNDRDVRYGDLDLQYENQFWGDFTHPSYQGQGKVADQLVNFISDSYSGPHFVQPWIHQ